MTLVAIIGFVPILTGMAFATEAVSPHGVEQFENLPGWAGSTIAFISGFALLSPFILYLHADATHRKLGRPEWLLPSRYAYVALMLTSIPCSWAVARAFDGRVNVQFVYFLMAGWAAIWVGIAIAAVTIWMIHRAREAAWLRIHPGVTLESLDF